MVDYLKEYAQSLYTDAEFEQKRLAYTHAQPFTKESLLYREIFEKYYPGQSDMVVDFWMPNKAWEGLRRERPLRARAVQLRCQRKISAKKHRLRSFGLRRCFCYCHREHSRSVYAVGSSMGRPAMSCAWL